MGQREELAGRKAALEQQAHEAGERLAAAQKEARAAVKAADKAARGLGKRAQVRLVWAVGEVCMAAGLWGVLAMQPLCSCTHLCLAINSKQRRTPRRPLLSIQYLCAQAGAMQRRRGAADGGAAATGCGRGARAVSAMPWLGVHLWAGTQRPRYLRHRI